MKIRSLSTKAPARSTLYTGFDGLDVWNDVQADEDGAIIQEWHFNHVHGFEFHPDPTRRGNSIWFALIEIEGKEPLVSKVYTSGIRRIGFNRPELTLAEIAKYLGWERAPEELLTTWNGEESGWH